EIRFLKEATKKKDVVMEETQTSFMTKLSKLEASFAQKQLELSKQEKDFKVPLEKKENEFRAQLDNYAKDAYEIGHFHASHILKKVGNDFDQNLFKCLPHSFGNLENIEFSHFVVYTD